MITDLNSLIFGQNPFIDVVHNESKGTSINRTGLIEALSKETRLAPSKAEQVVKMAFSSITKALVNGERIEIRGLGSFLVKHYDGYVGGKPTTGETLRVKPKKLPYFKCGKELKERVDICEGGEE